MQAQLALVLLCVLGFLLTGWERTAHTPLYCEPFAPGFVSQAINTWSNLAFFVAALAMVWQGDGRPCWYAFFAPLFMAHLALASMVFHRVLLVWSGVWDVVSIFVYLAFEATASLYLALRIWRPKAGPAFPALVFLLALLPPSLAIYAGSELAFLGDVSPQVNIVVSLYIAVAGAFEVFRLAHLVGTAPRDATKAGLCRAASGAGLGWAVACLLFGAPAAALWAFSDSHASPCEGHNLVGHGLWHVLIAVSMFALFKVRLKDPILASLG